MGETVNSMLTRLVAYLAVAIAVGPLFLAGASVRPRLRRRRRRSALRNGFSEHGHGVAVRTRDPWV
jgi:hypothetical protein